MVSDRMSALEGRQGLEEQGLSGQKS